MKTRALVISRSMTLAPIFSNSVSDATVVEKLRLYALVVIGKAGDAIKWYYQFLSLIETQRPVLHVVNLLNDKGGADNEYDRDGKLENHHRLSQCRTLRGRCRKTRDGKRSESASWRMKSSMSASAARPEGSSLMVSG